jgi:hypothetical protein
MFGLVEVDITLVVMVLGLIRLFVCVRADEIANKPNIPIKIIAKEIYFLDFILMIIITLFKEVLQIK